MDIFSTVYPQFLLGVWFESNNYQSNIITSHAMKVSPLNINTASKRHNFTIQFRGELLITYTIFTEFKKSLSKVAYFYNSNSEWLSEAVKIPNMPGNQFRSSLIFDCDH